MHVQKHTHLASQFVLLLISIVCCLASKALGFFFIFQLIATVSLLPRYCSWRVSQYLLSCQLVIDLPQLTGTVTGGQ